MTSLIIRRKIMLLLPLMIFSLKAFCFGDGLIFYASGNSPGNGFTADYAYGDPEPAYLNEYTIIPDGAKGNAFYAPHSEQKLMTYLAPGNIYAQRGTLSFFWRSRDPVGGMPFKLFYVSYCDHSSLDMTWLRVDYNGEQGFDAFVTDANMARVRVSYRPDVFPAPDKWTHIAFSWDETKGVRLYVDGVFVAGKDTTAVFDAGLGLFQPFGRFSTPGTVTSNCGHLRGGDIDEIQIYNCMLTEKDIRKLASGSTTDTASPPVRTISDRECKNEWWYRYGWNRDGDIPLPLVHKNYSIRKVEIHEVYDHKKWGWRSNDGIRETTWPDVYNRSNLPGRSDYFIEPDWYCYSVSGKSITYIMPDEPFNYCEITGAAYGTATHVIFDKESQEYRETELLKRQKGQERTFHKLDVSYKGGKVIYTNDVRETPLAEFNVYNITTENEPEGTVKLSYTLTANAEPNYYPCLRDLLDYIDKRYPADERQIMVGLPNRAPTIPKTTNIKNPLPVVHVLIPFEFRDEGPRTSAGAYGGFHYTWDTMYDGLDGLAIDIPALNVQPTHGEYYPLNIKVKDPLWPNRSMIDVSFSVKPGEPHTLFLDTRDRILPENHSLYITFAGAGNDFSPDVLEGTQIRLIFKKRADAVAEHEIDRFTQMRDNFGANMTETRPQRKKLEFLVRFNRDIKDLFSVNPDHNPGRYYWKWWNPEQTTLPYDQPEAPAGIPLWVFRQVEIVKQWRYFLNWWIDNRQIENGEFGGGLSDDGDFANCMPGLALIGVDSGKITNSLHRLMEAYYENGMFTNGLNTILTDALHATEEGVNVQSELMLLEYGDPKLVERMMETSIRYWDITGINSAGHRHFPSSFFSSTRMATEYPWCWSSRYAHTILCPGMVLAEFNGNPKLQGLLDEVADGILAHAQTEKNGSITLPSEINYLTDEARSFSTGTSSQLFRALYRWTGKKKYIGHLGVPAEVKSFPYVDKKRLEDSYAGIMQYNTEKMYIATEGFPWDDGPYISFGSVVEDRLGGAPVRRGGQFPEHVVSWKFDEPYSGESVALLTQGSSGSLIKVIGFNCESEAVKGDITGWDVEPGMWEIIEGIDDNGDDIMDTELNKRTVEFERTGDVSFIFPPRKTLVVQMKLKKKGMPYHKRPELGIGRDDITLRNNSMTVTVHNLGSVESPECPVALISRDGSTIVEAMIPVLKAPLDLTKKTCDIMLSVPSGTILSGCKVVIDPKNTLTEITKKNNMVDL
ncbi:MAG: hypothetical protein JXB48_16715 [Candidatus Latescibacteria bacterium]|nr:hypothetical protein [Candidatus Latescibacterota bacterium]